MTRRAPARNTPRRRPLAASATLTTLAALPFAVGAWRHAFVCDDAFITFRVAAHLAGGLGPLWNTGERVEG